MRTGKSLSTFQFSTNQYEAAERLIDSSCEYLDVRTIIKCTGVRSFLSYAYCVAND